MAYSSYIAMHKIKVQEIYVSFIMSDIDYTNCLDAERQYKSDIYGNEQQRR